MHTVYAWEPHLARVASQHNTDNTALTTQHTNTKLTTVSILQSPREIQRYTVEEKNLGLHRITTPDMVIFAYWGVVCVVPGYSEGDESVPPRHSMCYRYHR